MITTAIVLVAGVVFVLAAAMHVSSAAGEFDEHRRLDAWLHELHAEAPHEFDGVPLTRFPERRFAGGGVVELDGVSSMPPALEYFADGSL